jgi:hypothetical protein
MVSICWLADRLHSLYKPGTNDKLVDITFILTDRKSLDTNIREDIDKFTHLKDVVGIAKKADDLPRFLKERKSIIVTTQQKFSWVLEELKTNPELKIPGVRWFVAVSRESEGSNTTFSSDHGGHCSKFRQDQQTRWPIARFSRCSDKDLQAAELVAPGKLWPRLHLQFARRAATLAVQALGSQIGDIADRNSASSGKEEPSRGPWCSDGITEAEKRFWHNKTSRIPPARSGKEWA